MIAPLGQGRNKHVWIRASLLYTTGGALSSFAFGSCLGLLGRISIANTAIPLGWKMFSLWCLLLAFRDARIISFPLPQRKQQAPHRWLRDFGYFSAVLMWGIYIGLGVATFMVLSGYYALVIAAILCGPLFGGLTILGYWTGRALSVWLAPKAIGVSGGATDPLYPSFLPLARLRLSVVLALLFCSATGLILSKYSP